MAEEGIPFRFAARIIKRTSEIGKLRDAGYGVPGDLP